MLYRILSDLLSIPNGRNVLPQPTSSRKKKKLFILTDIFKSYIKVNVKKCLYDLQCISILII